MGVIPRNLGGRHREIPIYGPIITRQSPALTGSGLALYLPLQNSGLGMSFKPCAWQLFPLDRRSMEVLRSGQEIIPQVSQIR